MAKPKIFLHSIPLWFPCLFVCFILQSMHPHRFFLYKLYLASHKDEYLIYSMYNFSFSELQVNSRISNSIACNQFCLLVTLWIIPPAKRSCKLQYLNVTPCIAICPNLSCYPLLYKFGCCADSSICCHLSCCCAWLACCSLLTFSWGFWRLNAKYAVRVGKIAACFVFVCERHGACKVSSMLAILVRTVVQGNYGSCFASLCWGVTFQAVSICSAVRIQR